MNDNEVHLIFPDAQQKREFMNQLSDGWGENYVSLTWPWEHYWVIERYVDASQSWEVSDGGFRHVAPQIADIRLAMLQVWNSEMKLRVTEITPSFDDQTAFGIELIENEFYRKAWRIEEKVEGTWREIPDKSWPKRHAAITALLEYETANDPLSVKFRIKEDHERDN